MKWRSACSASSARWFCRLVPWFLHGSCGNVVSGMVAVTTWLFKAWKGPVILSKKHQKHQSEKGWVIFRKHLQPLIQRAVKTAARDHREICGVIVSNGFCLELVRTRNKSKAPGSFQIPLGRVRKIKRAARKMNHRVVGTFHSHPVSAAEPGTADIEGALGTLMLIIDCTTNEARLWRIQKRKAIPVPLHCIDG